MQNTNAPIGKVEKIVHGPVHAQDAEENMRALQQGDTVYIQDLLITGKQGFVKIVLTDGTSLQLGPLSRARMEEYQYNQETAEGHFEASIFVGLFRFISGKIGSNPQGEHTVIKTPSALIGIRGSEVDGKVEADGSTTVIHTSGLIDVSPLYHANKFSLYENGASIYIPIGELPSRVFQQSTGETTEFQEKFNTFHYTPATSDKGGQSDTHSDAPEKPENNKPPEKNEPSPPDMAVGRGDSGHDAPKPGSAGKPMEKEARIPEVQTGQIEKPPSPANPDGQKMPEPPKPGGDDGKTPSDPPPPPPPAGEKMEAGSDVPPPPSKPLEGYWNLGDSLSLELGLDRAGKSDLFPVQPPPPPSHEPQPELEESVLNTEESYVEGSAENETNTEPKPPEEAPPPEQNNSDVVGLGRLIANDDYVSTDQDVPLILFPSQLTGNDSTANPGDPLNIISVGSAINGSVKQNADDSIEFIPAPGFSGQADFVYQVGDSEQHLDSAKVFIDVRTTTNNNPPSASNSGNQAPPGDNTQPSSDTTANNMPLANTDVFNMYANTVLNLTDADLLGNDEAQDSDLQVIGVQNPNNGQVFLNTDGSIEFTSAMDFNGLAGFEYMVENANGDRAIGQVEINVLTSPDSTQPLAENGITDDIINLPGAQDDNLSTTVDTPLVIDALVLQINDSGQPPDAVISAVSDAINGQVIILADGQIEFTPDSGFSGQAGFSYEITDLSGNMATANVFIDITDTLTNVELLPDSTGTATTTQAFDDFFQTFANQDFIVSAQTLLANDYPVAPDNQVTAVFNAQNGNVALDAGGDIIFTPSPDFIGEAQFDYEIINGEQNSSTATAFILFEASSATQSTLGFDTVFNSGEALQSGTSTLPPLQNADDLLLTDSSSTLYV